jgi:hypothetical protein
MYYPCYDVDLQKMTEKCFQKCIVKPGVKLDGSDKVNFTWRKLWLYKL